MSVGHDGAYDVVLQDLDENPSIELGLILNYGAQNGGVKEWMERRASPLPPRQSEGPLSWTHKDPLTDFVFAQDSWHAGAFQPYYNDMDVNKYASANGVDLRWEGVAALGARVGPIRTGGTIKSRIQSNVIIVNGDWEEGQVVGWTAGTGVTATVESTIVNSGNYSGKAVVAQGTSAGSVWSQAFANPTVFRSREITVVAYLRKTAGSDANIFLRLTDSAGTPTDSTDVTTGAWTYRAVTRTIDAGATSVTLSIETDATLSTDAHTFYLDDCNIRPTGGTEFVGSAVLGSIDPDEIYVAMGRCVLLWDETTFSWQAVYINASRAATDIVVFDNVVYVAFGPPATSTPHQYIYGSSTTWTTAAINGTSTHHDNHATLFTKARNGFGNWALWKSGPATDQGAEVNRVAWATDPSNSGGWNPISPTQSTTYFAVGSGDRAITGLYTFRDTFVVTKVDGIWAWSNEFADFEVLTSEWDQSVSADNGSIGANWHNDLWINAVRQGFFRFGGTFLDDVSGLLLAPRLTDFGGKITAMTSGARELIIGLDTPVDDTTPSKRGRLARLSYGERSKKWELHTTHTMNMSLIDELSFHRDARLWAFGRTYDTNLADYLPQTNVMIEPLQMSAPYADVDPNIQNTGTFDTSIWHGNTPETDKAFIALTIWCENLDSDHTITVTYGRDGRDVASSTLGVFNKTGRIQTLFFKNIVNPKENAIGRFIQLRFTFNTIDDVSPRMYAFALHTQLVPLPIKVFELNVQIAGATRLRTGVPHELGKSEIESVFRQLELQVFPITMVEDLGLSHGGLGLDGENRRQVRLLNYTRVPVDDNERGQEVWTLVLQEVAVTIESTVEA
jgi:hypothetical protein